ncbi:MAG TPA: hypothetical protein VK858_13845 [Longimicrobiales bacterium]|nr:hypothetical protein [Longimicrobiales bacterium]
MHRMPSVLALVCLLLPGVLFAQMSDGELRARVAAATADDPGMVALVQGASAARLLGDFDQAEALLEEANGFLNNAANATLNQRILLAISSGRGVDGMQRALREERERRNLTPVQIANWANQFPSLLTGGEYDDMILSLSPDHPDPAYRCACLAHKAWVHRVAGRDDESREYWVMLAEARDRDPPAADNAQAQGQYARDLARAGRTAEARRVLEAAMAMEVSDEQRPAVQRRWAQAYAELGDVEGAVAQLEPLLASSTLVTVESLSTRYTWAPVRDHPAFQEMLARHR